MTKIVSQKNPSRFLVKYCFDFLQWHKKWKEERPQNSNLRSFVAPNSDNHNNKNTENVAQNENTIKS